MNSTLRGKRLIAISIVWLTGSDVTCRAYAVQVLLGSLYNHFRQSQVLQTLNIPVCFAECNGLKQRYYCVAASLFVVRFRATASTKLRQLCCVTT